MMFSETFLLSNIVYIILYYSIYILYIYYSILYYIILYYSIFYIFNSFPSTINISIKREGRKHGHLQSIKG